MQAAVFDETLPCVPHSKSGFPKARIADCLFLADASAAVLTWLEQRRMSHLRP